MVTDGRCRMIGRSLPQGANMLLAANAGQYTCLMASDADAVSFEWDGANDLAG